MPQHVQVLDTDGDGFVATLDDRSQVRARSVVVALGMDPHRRLPAELLELLPEGSWRHTCDLVDLSGAAGRRYLLVGGRQSAFEWAALLTEAGARSGWTSCTGTTRRRSPGPSGAGSPRWSSGWPPTPAGSTGSRLRSRTATGAGCGPRAGSRWSRGSRAGCRPAGSASGRARRWSAANAAADGSLTVTLDDGSAAWRSTRWSSRPATCRASTTSASCARATLPLVAQQDGLPDLDDGFQTSVPGSFTSLPATGHFGPFLGFTVAARMSAAVITAAVRSRAASAAVPPGPD